MNYDIGRIHTPLALCIIYYKIDFELNEIPPNVCIYPVPDFALYRVPLILHLLLS